MDSKISVVINTRNEAKCLERALKSLKWADEVVVCDMHSADKTGDLAKKLGAKVVLHDYSDYVEPTRNHSVSQASGEWILILDADEEIPEILAAKLQELAKGPQNINFVEIPRKNIIFGKQMKASFWWPDYNIRFFKKGSVIWSNEIHRPPETTGEGLKLPVEEDYAIVHHHYESTSQFIERMNRYTTIQAKGLVGGGYKFKWRDLIEKPLGEFLGRFFANRGFEDGLHGLALSFLQAFSFLVMYLKVWEAEKFTRQEVRLGELAQVSKRAGKDINYWLKYGNLSGNPVKRLFQKAKNRVF